MCFNRVDVEGIVSSISSTSHNNLFVCAMELPLESLCVKNFNSHTSANLPAVKSPLETLMSLNIEEEVRILTDMRLTVNTLPFTIASLVAGRP